MIGKEKKVVRNMGLKVVDSNRVEVKLSEYMDRMKDGLHRKYNKSGRGLRELKNLAWDMNDNAADASEITGNRRVGWGKNTVES